MKKTASLAILALLLSACSGLSKPPPLSDYTRESGGKLPPEYLAERLLTADLSLRVDPERQRIDATAVLVVQALEPLSSLALDLDRNFEIRSVAIDGQPVAAAGWSNSEGQLLIALPEPVAAGKPVEVTIEYGGKPHVAKRAPWDGGFVWAQTEDGQPWVGTAVEGEGCDLFWPCIDHPTAEPETVDLHISVPMPLVAPSNGVLLGVDEAGGWRTYHWRTHNPNTYAIALSIAPYKVLEGDYASRYGNTIPMRFWYLPGHEDEAAELFAEFPRMVDFFEQRIGPYPFASEKIGVVETPYKGMEHQTINAYGNHYVKDAHGYDDLLQHEFAHEWFGNQITNSDWDDMWLHEGFGTYMQPLYAQYLHGDMAYYAELDRQRAGIINRAPVVSGTPQHEEDVYNKERGPGGDIYVKGSLVLHSLRELIGDAAFFDATRRLVYGRPDPEPGNFEPRYASTQDLVDAVTAATGVDYSWFFDVYIRQAALPELLSQREGDELKLRWKVPGDRPFPMPVEVRVGSEVKRLPMQDGTGRVRAPADGMVTIDPHSKVLRRFEHVERFQAYRKAQEKKNATAK